MGEKIAQFVDEAQITRFISKQRQHLIIEYDDTSKWSCREIAKFANTTHQVVSSRMSDRTRTLVPTIATSIAKFFDADLYFVLDGERRPYTNEVSRQIFDELSKDLRRKYLEGDRRCSYFKMSKAAGYTDRMFYYMNVGRRVITLDMLVYFAQYVGRRLYVEMEHNFQHTSR